MATSKKEYDALVIEAEKIINSLMDLLEKHAPDVYSQSSEIAHADDWLKWMNGELTDQEVQEKFNYI